MTHQTPTDSVPIGGRTAVLAGTTGLVGTQVLELLLRHPAYHRIVALARQPATLQHEGIEARRADFENLDQVLADLREDKAPIDVYCCLGTTIKAAGSQAAFRRVDHDYVLALARWAKSAGARRFLLISALGADAASRVFYSRVKGETEDALRALNLRSLVIAQPSMLDGQRSAWRPGERIALAALRPIAGLLPARVRPVRVDDVAAALVLAADATQPEPILSSAAMQGASARLRLP